MRDRNIEEQHFELLTQIQEAYQAYKHNQGSLRSVVTLCQKQIEIAPQMALVIRADFKEMQEYVNRYGIAPIPDSAFAMPNHEGFNRLYEIRRGQRRLAEALELARQAQEQGWAGDWNEAIAECEAQLKQQEGQN